MKKLNVVNPVAKKGEDVSCCYLISKGFEIICRNYRENWGEIDIVAKKDNKIFFVEVKSVSRENLDLISHETYRPEENVHPRKVKRLSRVIQTFLLNNYVKEDPDWQFDIFVVYLDMKNKKAKVNRIEDVVL